MAFDGHPIASCRNTGERMAHRAAPAIFMFLIGMMMSGLAFSASGPSESQKVAESLAKMLQSARSVISKHQNEINDPAKGDKGLTAAVVLEEAITNYKAATGLDPLTIDPASQHGRLLSAQMASITEVMDANQALINQPGVGFKGLIPATFARLINEAFSRRVGAEAAIKVTAPPELVRNRKARPDPWEIEVIKTRFLAPDWPRGTFFAEQVKMGDKTVYRMMVPEYYAASCLSCHGTPKGSLDVTGYPREGAAEKDLGGVISVMLQTE